MDRYLYSLTEERVIWETEQVRFAYSPNDYLMIIVDKEQGFDLLSNKEFYELYAKLKAEIDSKPLEYWLKEEEN